MELEDLDSPAVIVNTDQLEENIGELQHYMDKHDILNRPHIKTHKITEIASMQLGAGAIGVTCQKLSEAEVMLASGIDNILIPYNIVGPIKLQRLIQLARKGKLAVTADSEHVVRGLEGAFSAAGLNLEVLVEFDTGMGRCGARTPSKAAELANLIVSSPHLNFGGLMTYPCNNLTDGFVLQVKSMLQESGVRVTRVSAGGTECMLEVHKHPEVTEYRAGTYVYGDLHTVSTGAMNIDQCALRVMTTVVSTPTPDRAIIDAGSKALSSDLLGLEGYGYVTNYPEALIYSQSEEHGHVDVSSCDKSPEVGERLEIIPNHCCSVTNLYDVVYGIRGNFVEKIWEVAARGCIQ